MTKFQTKLHVFIPENMLPVSLIRSILSRSESILWITNFSKQKLKDNPEKEIGNFFIELFF